MGKQTWYLLRIFEIEDLYSLADYRKYCDGTVILFTYLFVQSTPRLLAGSITKVERRMYIVYT